ncbi:MAG: VWA domain-containing protein [Oligoflexales bacterium]
MKLTLLSLGLHLVSGFMGPNPKLMNRFVNPITVDRSTTPSFQHSEKNQVLSIFSFKESHIPLFGDARSDNFAHELTDEELRKKLNRLESLAKTLTGDKTLSLESGDSWAYKSDTNTLVFPRADLDSISEEAAIALIARESGHRQYTSYPPEVAHNPAFKLLFNTIEQIRINRYMSGRHLGYHPLAFLAFRQFQAAANQVPQANEPPHKQFCLGLIDQSFGQKNTRWAQSPRVKNALQQVRSYVEEATELPIDPREMLIKGLSPEQIISSSETSYEIIKNKIWPVFQSLLESESQQKPEQNSANSNPSDGSPGDGSPSDGSPSDGSPSDGSPSDGSPSDGSPSDGSPNDGSPNDGSPSGGSPSDGSPSDGSPSGGSPSGGSPSDGSPSDGSPSDGSPSGGSPSGGSPSDGSPSERSSQGSNSPGQVANNEQNQDLGEIAKELQQQWDQLSSEQQRQIEDLARELESKLGEADPNNLENPQQNSQSENKPTQAESSNQPASPSDGDQPEDTQAGEGQDSDNSEQAGEGDGQPGEGDGQPGEGDGQPGEGDGQPGEGDGQPGEGDGQPGEGDGQPGEGDGQPGDGQSSASDGERINTDSISIVDSDEGAGGNEEGYQQHADNHQKLMEMIEEFKRRNNMQNIPDSYESLKMRNKQLIDELSEEVRHIFEDDSEPQLEGDYRSGIYNLQKAIESKARSQATGHKDDKIFLRKNHPEEKSVELVICLDTSGSMSGECITYAKDAVVVVAEMANELKFPWGLLTFSNSVDLLKELQKSEKEHNWEQALVDADASGGTDDFAALEKAVEMFTESDSEAEKKIILFMTDGSGNNRQKEYVKQMQEEGYWVIGIGIGQGTSYVAETYDRSVYVPKVEELPLELAQLMLELLREGTHK